MVAAIEISMERMILLTELLSAELTAQSLLREKDALYKLVPWFQMSPHDQILQTSYLYAAKYGYF